jgi:hypothetical protein
MNKEKVKEIVFKTISKIPSNYKFELVEIQEDKRMFLVNLISPEKVECQIFLVNGGFDELNEKQFMGVIAHELAHYWSGGVSEEHKKMMGLFRLKAIEESLLKRRELRKANQFKNKYLSQLKTKDNLNKLSHAWEEYKKLEERTDSFAEEKFGLGEEVREMRKVANFLELSLEFIKGNPPV